MFNYLKFDKNFLYFLFIIFGILTIFYQINFEDFWLDEMQSFWIADPELSWNETVQRHKYEYHNPILFNLMNNSNQLFDPDLDESIRRSLED